MSRKSPLLLALLITFTVGCSARVGYRVHDRGYGDYHAWDGRESGFYNNWVVETHRPHVEYRHLHRKDQDEYWRWRHSHR
jgi:hypothetical protein